MPFKNEHKCCNNYVRGEETESQKRQRRIKMNAKEWFKKAQKENFVLRLRSGRNFQILKPDVTKVLTGRRVQDDSGVES